MNQQQHILRAADLARDLGAVLYALLEAPFKQMVREALAEGLSAASPQPSAPSSAVDTFVLEQCLRAAEEVLGFDRDDDYAPWDMITGGVEHIKRERDEALLARDRLRAGVGCINNAAGFVDAWEERGVATVASRVKRQRLQRDEALGAIDQLKAERDEARAKLDKLTAATAQDLTDAMDRSPVAALLRLAEVAGIPVDPRAPLDHRALADRLASRIAGLVGERDIACIRLERVARRLGLAHDATAQELVEAIDGVASGVEAAHV